MSSSYVQNSTHNELRSHPQRDLICVASAIWQTITLNSQDALRATTKASTFLCIARLSANRDDVMTKFRNNEASVQFQNT